MGVGGSFLADDHTLEHWRDDVWRPSLFDRQVWDTWEAAGSPTIADAPRRTVEAALARHRAEPLDEKLKTGLEQIVAAGG